MAGMMVLMVVGLYIGIWILGNGVSFVYCWVVFEVVGGYVDNWGMVLGDDIFLIVKIIRGQGFLVWFLKSVILVVFMLVVLDWVVFLWQWLRWGIKNVVVLVSVGMMFVLGIVFLLSWFILLLFLLFLAVGYFWLVFLVLLLLFKFWVDYGLFKIVCQFFYQEYLLKFFVCLEVLYIGYIVFIGLAFLFV